jgi:hypothetical protein
VSWCVIPPFERGWVGKGTRAQKGIKKARRTLESEARDKGTSQPPGWEGEERAAAPAPSPQRAARSKEGAGRDRGGGRERGREDGRGEGAGGRKSERQSEERS